MPETVSGLRLAVAAGGTGGHVLPAMAVIDELRARKALEDTLWIGSADGTERQTAQEAGIAFVAIPTGKFRRYFSLRNLTDAVRVPLGLLAARRHLRTFRPDVILSTGGFVSVPTVIAASGIAPVLTHEQTATLGLATRINARFADVLAVSYGQTEQMAIDLHRRVVVTGNPVRRGLLDGDRAKGLSVLGFDDSLPVIYVTGGARGASPLNKRIAATLPGLLEHTQVIHQTGPSSANSDARDLLRRKDAWPPELQRRYRPTEFLREELPDVYAAADLVVGRAGAGTIAELSVIGKPSILIPLPGAGGDEQAVNARILSGRSAAVVLPQHEATPERLMQEIVSLLNDPDRRARMAAAARSEGRRDATSRLADALIALAAIRETSSAAYHRRAANSSRS